MLSGDEACDAMLLDGDDPNRLAIVPRPDLASIRKRAGTSIDLRLGRWFRSFKQSKSSHAKLWRNDLAVSETDNKAGPLRTNEHFVRFGDEFILHPGRFVLGATMEWLRLPRVLSGYVTGKSSLGRHGLVIETAAGLHPGFSGCLTLELANVGEVPLAISPGMEICQIFLHRTAVSKMEEPGNFSGQRKPAAGFPKVDPTFELLRGGRHKIAAAAGGEPPRQVMPETRLGSKQSSL